MLSFTKSTLLLLIVLYSHFTIAAENTLSNSEMMLLKGAAKLILETDPDYYQSQLKNYQYIKDRCDEAKKYHLQIAEIRGRKKQERSKDKSSLSLTYISDSELAVELAGRFNNRANALRIRGKKIISDTRSQLEKFEALNSAKLEVSISNSLVPIDYLIKTSLKALMLLENSFSKYSQVKHERDYRDYNLCSSIIDSFLGE